LLRRHLSAEFGSIFDGAFPFLGVRCDRLVSRVLKRLGLAAETNVPVPPRDRRVPSRALP
jgi:hypothetical protein